MHCKPEVLRGDLLNSLHASWSRTPQKALAMLDRESLPQSSRNMERKVRANPFPWAGRFSPQLVEKLLAACAPSGAVVLDSFACCGTTLAEAAAACGSAVEPHRPRKSVRNCPRCGARRSARRISGGRRRVPWTAVRRTPGPRHARNRTRRDLSTALAAPSDLRRKRLDDDTVPKSWTKPDRLAAGSRRPRHVRLQIFQGNRGAAVAPRRERPMRAAPVSGRSRQEMQRRASPGDSARRFRRPSPEKNSAGRQGMPFGARPNDMNARTIAA